MIHKLLTGAVVCLCVIASAAISQTRTAPQTTTAAQMGSFTGHLSGAGMDGATVTFTNPATGESKSTVTDNNGDFTIADLAPGTYRAVVRLKSGLQLRESSIEITAGGANQVQVELASAATAPAGKLELKGEAPTLETNSAEVSRSYDSQFVRSLPLLDRQHQEVVSLMPGVTPPALAGNRIEDPQRTRAFNVNGLPAYANLSNQDGAYNNEPYNNRPLRIAPDESVQAFEVRTSNYNAEYGLSGGSWSSTVTRPGTNAIHGSLFEFNTNSFFRSGRALTTSEGAPRFNTNQFGGTAGGPILPDRAFWFISYEGLMQRGREEAVATVPASGFGNGNFSQLPGAVVFNPFTGTSTGANRLPYPGNIITRSQLNLTAQQILGLIPSPNRSGFANNLIGSVPLLDDNHRVDAKLDHRLSEKSTGFFRYGFTQGSVDQGSLLGIVGSPLNSELRAMNAIASITEVFNTNVLAEFRFAYGRYRNQVSPWGDFSALNGSLSAFSGGMPYINISGLTPMGFPANVPRKETDNVYDGATNWMYHRGMHSFKFGVEVQELQSNGFSNPFFSSLGSFVFGPGATLGSTAMAASLTPTQLQANALASFLVGAPTQSGIANFLTTPAYRQRQYGAFATDTINLFHRLYLELGVRYDIFNPVEAAQSGGAVGYDPATNTTTSLGISGTSARYTRTDLNNIAPRVGLAFRPTNRFVIRAGYGIHYFPLPFAMMPFNPATQGVQSGIAGGLTTTAFAIPSVTNPGTTAPNLPFLITSRNMPTPYVQTFSGMVQGDLGNGFLMDIGYVGNLGRELPYNLPQTGLPGTGLAGLMPGRTALTIEEGNGLNSNYNSLQVNLTKKFAAGLALAAAYTYGKALDYGANLLDPFTRSSNYGPADWDRTHILSISHVWRLPFGARSTYFKSGWAGRLLGDWEITGILRWATGTPYTVTADPTACGCLGASAVPASFAGTQGTPGINGSSSFDTSLFSTPAAGTFGTLSRNAFRGPDFFSYNAALFRNFAIKENIKLEFRGEAYNLTNTTNLGNPIANATAPGFGTSVSTLDGLAGRQFQVAVRLLY